MTKKLAIQIKKLHTKIIKELDKWIEDNDTDTGRYNFQNGTYFEGYMQALKDITQLNNYHDK